MKIFSNFDSERKNEAYKEMVENNYKPVNNNIKTYSYKQHTSNSTSKLDVRIREWRDYDLEYWDLFKIPEIPHAPHFDGYTDNDVLIRLTNIIKNYKNANTEITE